MDFPNEPLPSVPSTVRERHDCAREPKITRGIRGEGNASERERKRIRVTRRGEREREGRRERDRRGNQRAFCFAICE